MKKIISILAIAIMFVSASYCQTPIIHFDNGTYKMDLHPKNANGCNKEVVTFAGYDNFSQTPTLRQIEVEYEIINPKRIAYENRKMLNNFAATELVGFGASAIGAIITIESAKKDNKFGYYSGIGLAVAGGITCIVGYIPLLKGADVYVTENGIGIRYKIKNKN